MNPVHKLMGCFKATLYSTDESHVNLAYTVSIQPQYPI